MADDVSMQTKVDAPALPPTGEVVDEGRLYLTQIALYSNSLAFGGAVSPSVIWNSMVRNESRAIMYYRELEEKDEDVGNCLDSLKLAVLQRGRLVTPGGKTTKEKESSLAIEIAQFVQQQFDELPNFHAVLDCLLDAPGYGFSIGEMIFDVSEGQVSLVNVKDCPQELFLFGNRFRPQVGQLQLLDSPWAMQGQLQPENKFLIFTYRGRAQNRMGQPLLRRVFWPSWFKRNVLRLWLQYCEKGPGTVVTRYNDSDSEASKQRAAEIAKAIAERNAIAVPQNFQYDSELLKVARALNPDVYMKLQQAMQYNIARRILGETLTSFGNEGGTGAKAQGEVHADTLEQRIIELARAVESVVNRQLVRPLVLWNYGPDAPMPTWGFDLEEEEDLSMRIVIDSALQRMGKQIPTQYVVDRYDIPAIDGEAATMVPNVNAPQVALQARDVSTFAEALSMLPEMAHDHSEFDTLYEQLKKEAMGPLAVRSREVADTLKRGRR
jgi:phage gp29-like protein